MQIPQHHLHLVWLVILQQHKAAGKKTSGVARPTKWFLDSAFGTRAQPQRGALHPSVENGIGYAIKTQSPSCTALSPADCAPNHATRSQITASGSVPTTQAGASTTLVALGARAQRLCVHPSSTQCHLCRILSIPGSQCLQKMGLCGTSNGSKTGRVIQQNP